MSLDERTDQDLPNAPRSGRSWKIVATCRSS